MIRAGDRRRHPRHRVRLPLRYRLLDARPPKYRNAQSLNVSEGGLCLRSTEFVPHNSLAVVELNVPNQSRPVRVVSRVVSSRQHYAGQHFLLGLRFLDLPEKAGRSLAVSVRQAGRG